MYTIYCEHSLISDVRGDLTDILCTAVNLVTSGEAIEAQSQRMRARQTLVQTGIIINGVQIPLHLDNPFTARRIEGRES